MLYLVIPPIVIVVCSALLIFFISRKISKVPIAELMKQDSNNSGGVISGMNHATLVVLEGSAQWFKGVFLKFHNRFDNIFQAIKEKRKEVKQKIDSESCLLPTISERIRKVSENLRQPESIISDGKSITEEQAAEPMLSKDIVQPDSKTVVKEKLEHLLIERIATDPRDIEAYERLGDYYMERKCYRDARECFKHVLKLSPASRKTKLKMRRLDRIFLK